MSKQKLTLVATLFTLTGCEKPTDDVGIATEEVVSIAEADADDLSTLPPDLLVKALQNQGSLPDDLDLEGLNDQLAGCEEQQMSFDNDGMIYGLTGINHPVAGDDCRIVDSCRYPGSCASLESSCIGANLSVQNAYGVTGAIIGKDCWACTPST